MKDSANKEHTAADHTEFINDLDAVMKKHGVKYRFNSNFDQRDGGSSIFGITCYINKGEPNEQR